MRGFRFTHGLPISSFFTPNAPRLDDELEPLFLEISMNEAFPPAGSEGPSQFELGRVLMTRGIQALVLEQRIDPQALLQRHVRGDWGDLDEEDTSANDAAIDSGRRLLSSYRIDGDLTVWIITEAGRDVTTLLLPSEY